MNRAAKSVFAFGLYLVGVGLGLLIAPNAVLAPLGFAPAEETWMRVAGVLALVLACYYVFAARTGLAAFFRCTVATRIAVFVAFVALALLGLAPRPLALLGAVDLAGAIWTLIALRSSSTH